VILPWEYWKFAPEIPKGGIILTRTGVNGCDWSDGSVERVGDWVLLTTTPHSRGLDLPIKFWVITRNFDVEFGKFGNFENPDKKPKPSLVWSVGIFPEKLCRNGPLRCYCWFGYQFIQIIVTVRHLFETFHFVSF